MRNEKLSGTACEKYEARLEEAVERAAERGEILALSADLAMHVSGCEHCGQSLDAASLSNALLRWGLEPTAAPGPWFAARVLSAIRAEEDRRTSQRQFFWLPLEHLSARMAIAAATVVMGLTIYVYAYVVPQSKVGTTAQTETYELVPQPQIDPQPQSKDEVLMSILERNNAR